jgi:UDP-N-acetylmuramoylalanine--D-glutamate ligase
MTTNAPDIRNTRILVVGLARSGLAAARFLTRRGAVVSATDAAAESALPAAAAELRALGVRLHLGGHPVEAFTGSDLIVLSPGVPHTIEPIRRAQARGIPVIGELELAARFIAEPIVAVTGTNGKTTTTRLIGRMLECSGRRVFVGGNIGTPLIGYVDSAAPAEVVVAEVSSFQLDTIESFRPAVGVLLNITADHLDRYLDFDAYARSKMRLFMNQLEADVAVLNGADTVIARYAGPIRARRLTYNAAAPGDDGAAVSGGRLRLQLRGAAPLTLKLGRFPLRGPHNLENASAAALAALVAGATAAGIQQALDSFTPLPHRLETVASVGGVAYVNDSKATNVDAVLRALDCFEGPLVLIMGGLDKAGDFTQLAPAVRRHVKTLILIGAAREKIRAALTGTVPVHDAADMEAAVRAAAAASAAGDSVLLAPGCASFDMYANYQARGDDFRDIVMRLAGRSSPREDA